MTLMKRLFLLLYSPSLSLTLIHQVCLAKSKSIKIIMKKRIIASKNRYTISSLSNANHLSVKVEIYDIVTIHTVSLS